MKAKHCLLTHFSQRYPKFPKLQPEQPPQQGDQQPEQPVIAIAFDLMSIRVGDMWKVEHYQRPFEKLFKQQEGDEGGGSDVGGGNGDSKEDDRD
jgi:ribonuclease Z